MARRIMPNTSAPLVNDEGRVKEPWRTYLEKDACKLVADLAATPTNAEISTAFNDLLAKLKAAGLMETI